MIVARVGYVLALGTAQALDLEDSCSAHRLVVGVLGDRSVVQCPRLARSPLSLLTCRHPPHCCMFLGHLQEKAVQALSFFAYGTRAQGVHLVGWYHPRLVVLIRQCRGLGHVIGVQGVVGLRGEGRRIGEPV